jgi:hypothetical protein
MSRDVATSTVALTMYNLLATARGARRFEELANMVSAWAEQSRIVVPESQMRRALIELGRRGYVREGIGGLFDVCDPDRRPVVERDRSDAGKPEPGWRGWRVYSRPVAMPKTVPLDEVAK